MTSLLPKLSIGLIIFATLGFGLSAFGHHKNGRPEAAKTNLVVTALLAAASVCLVANVRRNRS